ncbi:hypothetical protein DFP85_1287 [Halomonas ventosae]|uniref:Uncharacterized protein n=1 Tax=Halomonas ventosae TaxID=229007 RepID=A0A4R6ZEI1_9GAMM|nr:hypothetical protein [Halomonas ventosae]TDR50209.1 hypothetical protein DFP85_1287 [Halomonas ventosae]
MFHEQLKQNARDIAALEKRLAELERLFHEKRQQRASLVSLLQ